MSTEPGAEGQPGRRLPGDGRLPSGGRPEDQPPAFAWRARLALVAVFFANGILGGSFAVRLPDLMRQLEVGTGPLGLAFTASVVAALATMRLAGAAVTRFGSRAVCRLSVVLFCLVTAVLPTTPTIGVFAAVMALFGVSGGALGVAMNAQAVVIENVYRRPVMSGFHAMYSIGGVTAAGVGALATRADLAPALHIGLVATASAVLVSVLGGWLLPDASADPPTDATGVTAEPTGDRPAGRPSRLPLLALGAIAFCFYLAEAAVDDWSAIYLNGSLGTTTSIAALGYGAFSVAMAVGRLFGDWTVSALGNVRTVRLGALAAGGSLTTGLLVNHPLAAIAAFGVFGLGMCVVAPVTYSATGNLPDVDRGRAIAQVTVIGYCGLLAGPVVIGTVGEWASLRAALAIPAALALLIGLMAGAVRPRRRAAPVAATSGASARQPKGQR